MPAMKPYVKYRTKRFPWAMLARNTPSPKRMPPVTPTTRGPTHFIHEPAPKAAKPSMRAKMKNVMFMLVMFVP